jgi:hypothetical protein
MYWRIPRKARRGATQQAQISCHNAGTLSILTSLRNRWRRLLLAVLALAAAWIAIDVLWPGRSDLREFDPKEVARLETDMWRSYYERHQVRLFLQLTELLRTQYHMSFLRSNIAAYHAARAAFVFKDGSNRAEYERALPNLTRLFTVVNRVSSTPFNVDKVSRLELEWWIIHRQREQHGPDALARSLMDLQAEVFHLPPERFAKHGQLRAEAMTVRDAKWAAGGVSEADWSRIHELLQGSWQDLWTQVRR